MNENQEQKTKKPWYKKWWIWLIIVLVLGAMGNQEEENGKTDNEKKQEKKQEEKIDYKIVEEKINDRMYLRIQSDITTENEFKKLADELFKKYEDRYESEGFEAIHAWVHFKDGEGEFGTFKGTIKIAYTNTGRVQTGVEEGKEYAIEINKEAKPVENTTDTSEPSNTEVKEPTEQPKEEPVVEAEPAAESTPVNEETISKAEFDAIKNGMTYDEVVDIIGSEGELLSESGAEGDPYYTVMYQWYGEGSLGANANAMFQGGKMMNKAQFGLK